MPKATRKIVTATSSVKAAKASVAKAAVAARAALPVIATPAKPAPTASAVSNATAIVNAAAAPAVAKPSGNITRTAAAIVRAATNFGSLSDRDTAYLGFYRRLAATLPNGIVTLAGIVASGLKPAHIGSNKPHDAGVINRLTKAGIVAKHGTDGHGFTITDLGRSLKAD